jgi:hypothetical protein
VNFGEQEFGEEIFRLEGILENANMLCHDMQPNALLIWQNFVIIKSGCNMIEEVLHHVGLSRWMLAFPFAWLQSHLIPSVEFSPTNSPEDEGNLFVHSNPLEQVHIIYMSVTKLSLAERLILTSFPRCYGWKCHHRPWP